MDQTNAQSTDNTVGEDESTATVREMFQEFQVELDSRNDKYERLIKLSRDITIESKRIIFQLHRVDSAGDRIKGLAEVHQKLASLQRSRWRGVAFELRGEDPYQYLRAYSPGLQEYIEALSFHHYLQHNQLMSYQQVAASLDYGNNVNQAASPSADSTNLLTDATVDTERQQRLFVHVPPIEYLMGIADLTGELMRLAINSVGHGGDLNTPFDICRFLRDLQTAFTSLGNISARDLWRKVSVMRQSERKVQAACYALRVRGSEVLRHLLADSLNHAVTNYGATDDLIEHFE